MGMENRKHERPVSEAAVFCLEQYDCEMAPAMSKCKTKPSHKVSTWPKYQRRLLFAIVDVGGGRRCGVWGGMGLEKLRLSLREQLAIIRPRRKPFNRLDQSVTKAEWMKIPELGCGLVHSLRNDRTKPRGLADERKPKAIG